jgi:hypothetical protein
MARHQPLTATRREFCVASAAALVGLTIKGDRPLAGGFVNDDMPTGHTLRARGPVGAAAAASPGCRPHGVCRNADSIGSSCWK